MTSINFKLQVVAEYQAGVNLADIKKKYNLLSAGVITEWVYRYERSMPEHLYNNSRGDGQQYHTLQQQLERLEYLKQRVTQLEELMHRRTIHLERC